MGTRIPRLPQSTGDVEFSNNRATVWGLQGLPMQEVDTNTRGVLYLDPSLERWSIQESYGDVIGNWPNQYVNGIRGIAFDVNAAPPLHGQVPSFSDTNSSLSWVDTNSLMGTAGGDLSGSYPNPTVVKIQAVDVNPATPVNGQALVYSTGNSKWNPTTGVAPSGPAGGDLSGTYPNPTVVKIQTFDVNSATPLTGQALVYGGNNKWNPSQPPANSTVICEDQQTSGTAGGTFTTGAWRTRVLNTEVKDDGSIASLASNEVTLQPGTYDFVCSAPAHRTGGHKIRLYDVTNAAVLSVGTSEQTGTTEANDTRSWVRCRATLAGTVAVRIEHYCASTRATDGLGQASGIPSTVEVFATFQATKVS